MKNSKNLLSYLLLSLTLFLAGCGGGGDAEPVLERKNAAHLSAGERAEFVDTLLRMKQIPSQFAPAVSAYDYFVNLHVDAFKDHQSGAHMAPGFLPWHREFLYRFELEMRRASGNQRITLPYWDWTEPGSVEAIFSDDFLGGDGDANQQYFVMSGPFRKGNWAMAAKYDDTDDEFDGKVDDNTPLFRTGLQRKFNQNGDIPLPLQAEVDSLLNVSRPYDAAPYDVTADSNNSMRNYLEGWRAQPGTAAMHNAVHVWVGGQMQTGSSPNDPVFFLHHTNIDRLWSQWQERYGSSAYPNDAHYNSQNQLYQFGALTVADTFSLKYHSGVVYR